jgi:hypothetical protein
VEQAYVDALYHRGYARKEKHDLIGARNDFSAAFSLAENR